MGEGCLEWHPEYVSSFILGRERGGAVSIGRGRDPGARQGTLDEELAVPGFQDAAPEGVEAPADGGRLRVGAEDGVRVRRERQAVGVQGGVRGGVDGFGGGFGGGGERLDGTGGGRLREEDGPGRGLERLLGRHHHEAVGPVVAVDAGTLRAQAGGRIYQLHDPGQNEILMSENGQIVSENNFLF